MSDVDLGPMLADATKRPYPGLRTFRRGERFIFFGRDEQIDQLLERLGRSRFLAVVGASGSGKSSLVRAGLIDALEMGFMALAGARWRVATMQPGDRPMWNLARGLMKDGVIGPGGAPDPVKAALLQATLRRGPLGLVEVLGESPAQREENILVVVDQFEEIFRYRNEHDPDEADAFVALLLASARQERRPIYVVLTMRSDFLGDCAVFRDLPEILNDCQFLIPRLSREQRREAIEGPARVFDGRVEPDLVNRLLNDMGPEPDQLPQMQHALMRMWNHATRSVEGTDAEILLTSDDYAAIGRFDRALSDHADEVYDQLDSDRQRIARILFLSLSDRADRHDSRRPVPLGVVAEVAGVPHTRVAEVVDVFRRPDQNFLTPAAEVPLDPNTILDISHESLIRLWGRLNGWVKQEAESADMFRRLAETAQLWTMGRAGLWDTPDLDIALAWKNRESPNAAWARRYGGDLELCFKFLRISKQKSATVSSRRKTLLFNIVLLLALTLSLSGLVWLIAASRGPQMASLYILMMKGETSDFVPEKMPAGVQSRIKLYPASGRITYELSKEIPWVGIAYLSNGRWRSGEWQPYNSFNLFKRLGAKYGDRIRCRFWARSTAKDGATVQFGVGGASGDSLTTPAYAQVWEPASNKGGGGAPGVSLPPRVSTWIHLGPDWSFLDIDLTNRDVSSLVCGFSCVCEISNNDHDPTELEIGTFNVGPVYFINLSDEARPKDLPRPGAGGTELAPEPRPITL